MEQRGEYSSSKAQAQPTPEEVKAAVDFLISVMGPVKFVRTANLIGDVLQDTRHGDVRFVIVDGKVKFIRVEKSYD